jgi:hypothetical protein
MRAGVAAATFAAFLSGSGAVWAACPHGQTRNCLDLDGVPQISRQIVATERTGTAPKGGSGEEAKPNYTGPTVGVSRTVRQAPMVGYRWAID